MTFRIIEMGEGARIEKKDKDSYGNYREVAKILVDKDEDTREILNELREIIDRDREIKEIVEENKDLMKKLE